MNWLKRSDDCGHARTVCLVRIVRHFLCRFTFNFDDVISTLKLL